MKKITLLIFMLVSVFGFAQFPAPYCGPLTFTNNVEPITLVNFAGINNTTDATVGAVNPAHEDFTAIVGNVSAGSTYPITLKGNTDGTSFTTKLRVYIDWNKNNDFTDAGESYDIGNITGSTGTDAIQLVGSIAVPVSALAGNTRMRVIKKYSSYATSCQTGAGYGQAEDYTLSVTIPSCISPSALVSSSVTPSSATISWTAPSVAPSEGYDYYYATSSTAPTSSTVPSGSVAAGTTTVSLSSLTPASVYYCYVRAKCSTTLFSDWSVVTFTTPAAPPVNDDASGAILLTLDLGTACGANQINLISNEATTPSAEVSPTCITQYNPTVGNGDMWYKIVVPNPDFTLNLSNVVLVSGSFYTVAGELYSGTPGNLTPVGACGNSWPKNYTGLTVGDTYYLRVWDYGNDGLGTFSLCGYYLDCVNASASYSVISDCANAPQFFVDVNVTDLGSATSLTLSDDYGSTPIVANNTGIVTFGPYPNGTSVIFTIANDQNAACTVVSSSQTQSACPPDNDDCSGAIELTAGGIFDDNILSGTIYGATLTSGVSPSCQTLFNSDVWYSVVVPASGSITIETQVADVDSMTDSVVTAFSGTCGLLTPIGCDDDGGPTGVNTNMSILSLTALNPGDTIYIGVWKYAVAAPTATKVNFKISAYDASLANNTFANSSFNFYPNPVKNLLNISNATIISKVQVLNLLGQEMIVKSMNETQGQVDMSQLAAGTYLVKVTSDNQVKTIKVVKE